ncbi:helix-turn-helix domain-containing protein [Acutalibacter muris]|nr:helix-turn-helix domain-containing protein [Acutalibacter muris]
MKQKMYNMEGLYQSDLPKRAILVYMYLSDRAGKEGQCFPSVPTIARQTKMSEATVHRAIRDLEKGGFLYVTGRQRPNGADSSNLYTLTNAEPGW